MSHNTTYNAKITNIELFFQVLRDRHIEYTNTATVQLFGSNHVEDTAGAFILPGWKYPIAITKKGELIYDAFGSEPGAFKILGEIHRHYDEAHIRQEIDYTKVANVTTEYSIEEGTGEEETIMEIYFD